MALDERYVLMQGLDQYFVDKDTGLPLANGNLFFFRDSARNTAKTVYQLSGTFPNYTYTALPNPVPLSAVGTPQNAGADNVAIYFFPYDSDGNLDLYYVQCKDQDGTEQFTREAWPNTTGGSNPNQSAGLVNNEISNAQFSKAFINGSTTTYTFVDAAATEVPIAPDWTMVVSSTGSATVAISRTAYEGADNIVTSPPYALNIETSAGITQCDIRQRFDANSGLWSSQYLAGSFVAKQFVTIGGAVSMYYLESDGGTQQLLCSGSLTGTFKTFDATPVLIPQSANTQTGTNGHIDIYLSISAGIKVEVTSIQVVPTTEGNLVPYDIRSSNREQAMMGDYYIPRLVAKPITSLLTAWDFPLNPAQILGPTVTVNTTPKYVWDQTIMGSTVGNVLVTRSTTSNGLQAIPQSASEAFYMLQYLSGAQARKMIGTSLSVNVSAYQAALPAVTAAEMRIYLYRAPTATVIPTLATTIGTIAASGVFSLTAAGWTEIPRSNLGTPIATLPVKNVADYDPSFDIGFNGWEITDGAQIADTDKFAIVVTFKAPIDLGVITINSISQVPGDLPCRPAPQTLDDVLRECRYYYEKSYEAASVPGTVTAVGQKYALNEIETTVGGADQLYLQSFQVDLMEEKRVNTYTLTFYSPVGTPDAIYAGELSDGVYPAASSGTNPADYSASGFWAQTGKSKSRVFMKCAATSTLRMQINVGISGAEGAMLYHYICNAQLGVV